MGDQRPARSTGPWTCRGPSSWVRSPRPTGSKQLYRPANARHALPPDAFVHIRPDGTIVIQVNRLEFGQGVYTARPMLLADEMDADWSRVKAELAPAAAVYNDPVYQMIETGASCSIYPLWWFWKAIPERRRRVVRFWFLTQANTVPEAPVDLDSNLRCQLVNFYQEDVLLLERLLRKAVPWSEFHGQAA